MNKLNYLKMFHPYLWNYSANLFTLFIYATLSVQIFVIFAIAAAGNRLMMHPIRSVPGKSYRFRAFLHFLRQIKHEMWTVKIIRILLYMCWLNIFLCWYVLFWRKIIIFLFFSGFFFLSRKLNTKICKYKNLLNTLQMLFYKNTRSLILKFKLGNFCLRKS